MYTVKATGLKHTYQQAPAQRRTMDNQTLCRSGLRSQEFSRAALFTRCPEKLRMLK